VSDDVNQYHRGRSNPGCLIVGSSTREELTTEADFQSSCHGSHGNGAEHKVPVIRHIVEFSRTSTRSVCAEQCRKERTLSCVETTLI